MVTDYDCWHETEEEVSVEAVLAVLRKNVDTAKRIIREAVPQVPASAPAPAGRPRATPS